MCGSAERGLSRRVIRGRIRRVWAGDGGWVGGVTPRYRGRGVGRFRPGRGGRHEAVGFQCQAGSCWSERSESACRTLPLGFPRWAPRHVGEMSSFLRS
jgi:hypothetical protein